MNSIRPLATITLLAVVGVFLYFKINEVEPTLPADVADWNLPENIDISEGSGGAELPTFETTGTPDTSGASGAPTYSSAPAGDAPAPFVATAPPPAEVPAFNPSVATPSAPMAAVPTPPELPSAPVPDAPFPSFSESISGTNEPGLPRVAKAAPANPNKPDDAGPPRRSRRSLRPRGLPSRPPSTGGELSQALLLLSDWYGDPSLSPEEKQEVDSLLSQLAGSVVYSTEHRLEPPYLVQANERLEDIAKQYNVPWQLLAKINGIDRPDALQPGQKLKVVRGPFSALIDLSDRQMTLMLDRRYAGKFAVDIDPQATVEEGNWSVEQKLVTPGNIGQMTAGVTARRPKSRAWC